MIVMENVCKSYGGTQVLRVRQKPDENPAQQQAHIASLFHTHHRKILCPPRKFQTPRS